MPARPAADIWRVKKILQKCSHVFRHTFSISKLARHADHKFSGSFNLAADICNIKKMRALEKSRDNRFNLKITLNKKSCHLANDIFIYSRRITINKKSIYLAANKCCNCL